MAFTEQRYQDGFYQLSLFLSCCLAETAIDLAKGGGPLPAIRPDLQQFGTRIGVISQSLLHIALISKEGDISGNLYSSPFCFRFGQVARLVNFLTPFYDFDFDRTGKGRVESEKKALVPRTLIEQIPVFLGSWDAKTCIDLNKCISVMEDLLASILAVFDDTQGGHTETSPWSISVDTGFVNHCYYLVQSISRAQLDSLTSFFLDQSVVKFPSSIGHRGSIRFVRDELNDELHSTCTGYDSYGKEITMQVPTTFCRSFMTGASNARPRLEDIEVWEGQNRCSKFAHSLGKLLLRCELEVSFQTRRPKRMIIYLYADRLAIFRAKGTALVLQLDTFPRDLLLITNTFDTKSITTYITIYWDEKVDETSSVGFAKLFFRNAEESQVWESFLAATLLPRAGTEANVPINGASKHENTRHDTDWRSQSVLESVEHEEQGTSFLVSW